VSPAGETVTPAPPGAASAGAPPARIVSIRWIVTSAVVALITLIVLGAGTLSERNAREVLTAQLEARLLVQSQNLALSSAGALLSDFPELTLQPIVNEMRVRQPELEFIAVVDRRGRIQGHTETRLLGTPLTLPPGLVAGANAPRVGPGQELSANARLLVASTTVVAAGGVNAGRAVVALRRDYVDRALARSRRQQLLALAAFLALAIVSGLALVTSLLRPIGALREGIERIGRGDLETPLVVRDRTELGALAGTLNGMARELRAAQSKMIERERLAHEMELAQRIQLSLLPRPRIVGGRYLIDGGQQAAAQVGGDLYDILDLPGGRVGLVVADVSGKGVAGSLVTAMLKALVRALAPAHRAPSAMLHALDRQLGELLERGSFVTLFYGVLDTERDVLTFASAGHNPMLVLRASGAAPEWLRPRGPALGVMRGPERRASYEECEVAIGPGDVLVQYTDGISEALAPDGDSQFGLERIADCAVAARRGGGPQVLRSLSRAVAEWRGSAEQSDDETLLVIERRAEAKRVASDGPSDWSDPAVALADLAVAVERGRRLTLPAALPALVRVDDWLARLERFASLEPRALSLVRLGLQEACSNVVEHACHRDPTLRFDLWWVPGSGPEPADPLEAIERGWFLLRDRGDAFDQRAWRPKRLDDPEVRRRGRGFGLDILHKLSEPLQYCPNTPEGNLMRLFFHAAMVAPREEAS
jgi:serine phosphatase RsbU (regulator of sigma subunit)